METKPREIKELVNEVVKTTQYFQQDADAVKDVKNMLRAMMTQGYGDERLIDIIEVLTGI